VIQTVAGWACACPQPVDIDGDAVQAMDCAWEADGASLGEQPCILPGCGHPGPREHPALLDHAQG
jgi:hypothetical protein